MSSELTILLLATSLNLLLSITVLLRNPKRAQNISFAMFGLNVALWAIFNYLADNAANNNLLFTRLTVLFGSLIAASLLCLSYIFPKRVKHHRVTRQALVAAALINAALTLSSACVPSVTVTTSGAELHVGWAYPIFMLYMVVFIAWSSVNFARQYKTAHTLERSQIKLFVMAYLLYGFFAVASNVVLPLFINSWAPSKFGPIFSVPFVGITAYAIIKHHLFDVRTVIARILAYIVTLAIIVAIYSMMVVFIVAKLVSLDHLSETQLLLLALPTVICTLTFPHIKSLIDKMTANLFFRDIYQIRDVLDKLSNILINENDVKGIVRSSARLLNTTLHPTSICVVVFGEDGNVFDEYLNNRDMAPANLSAIAASLAPLKDPIISKDADNSAKVASLINETQADVILRLKSNSRVIGLVLFGNKKNGSPYSNQDIKLLRVAANNLSVALDNAWKYEQITHFASTLKQEVLHATQRLQHANDKLRTLDKLKDDFLSMASHQFRTPAGSIRQAFKMVHDPNLTKKDREEVLALAEANSEQLVNLVNTMLNISRIEAGRFSIDRTLTDIPALLDKVILATEIVADQKHVKLDFQRPDHTIFMEVDRAKINEAMKNYIENAIKYSSDNSSIGIVLRQESGSLYFEVKDTGMGVPEKDRHGLFGKFYRAKNARELQPDGNGIGLYVVKEIVEGHGGEVYYQPLAQGSLFGFKLPLLQPHHHATPSA